MQHHDSATDPTTAPTVVLGAGPCGLAAGWYLATAVAQGARGAGPPVLIERSEGPGGLARTFAHGRFRFDLSIHRFQAGSPDFELELDRLFPGERLHQVEHKTIHVHLGRRRIPYPLRPGSALALPPLRGARAALQVARRRLGAPHAGAGGAQDPASYRAWFEEAFGPELYRWIAGPLMLKQWGLPGEQLCASFARHRRLSVTLRDLLAGTPLIRRGPGAIAPTFVYGEQGSGPLMERLAEQLRQAGGDLRCGVRPTRLLHRDGLVREAELSSGERLACRALVSTIPLPALLELLDPPPPADLLAQARGLRFRDLVVVALPLRRERVSQDHVTYYPEAAFPFSRTFEQKNASARMAPTGRTIVGFELPCAAGDPIWSLSDEGLIRWMTGFGPQVGFHPGEVEGGAVVRTHAAYPLYELGHRPRADALIGWVHGALGNCYLVGRNGLFRLDNMHHAIGMGRDLARHLARGGAAAAWQEHLGRYADLSYID